jgi:hypothetical protein
MARANFWLPRLNQVGRIIGSCAVALFGSGFGQSTSSEPTNAALVAPSIPQRVKAVREKIAVEARDPSRASGPTSRFTQFFKFPNFRKI